MLREKLSAEINELALSEIAKIQGETGIDVTEIDFNEMDHQSLRLIRGKDWLTNFPIEELPVYEEFAKRYSQDGCLYWIMEHAYDNKGNLLPSYRALKGKREFYDYELVKALRKEMGIVTTFDLIMEKTDALLATY